jgi:hypothetical protein
MVGAAGAELDPAPRGPEKLVVGADRVGVARALAKQAEESGGAEEGGGAREAAR